MNKAVVYSDALVTYTTIDAETNNHIWTEKVIIDQLKRFSESDFVAMRWEQYEENKLLPRKATFFAFKNMDEKWQYLIRLWTIIESASLGRLIITGTQFSHFMNYLTSSNTSLKNVGKDTFRGYKEYLDSQINERTQKPFVEPTKYNNYDLALRFFRLMKGHPEVASIKGIEAMRNPYSIAHSSDKNRQIPQWKLEITDKYFSDPSIVLTYRIWYWLMRLYGVRPSDVESYPLECVKELRQDEIATMKTYVGKQTGAINRIDMNVERPFKIELLNLKEDKQNMLYKLIQEQQNIAQQLQEKVETQGFLMTRELSSRVAARNVFIKKYTATNYEHVRKYWDTHIKPLFKPGEHPTMKEFKHTAVSKRATWGTHTHDALRDFANHQSMNTIDSYTKPATKDQIDMQKKITAFTSKTPLDWMFKGEAVYDIKNILPKIMANPYAHQLPGYGFCPDASVCGNHFECLGCDFLVANPNLREYYFEQAQDYIRRADNLAEFGKNHNADDRMAVAVKFYRLYLRTFDEDLKDLENVEEINLKEVNFG